MQKKWLSFVQLKMNGVEQAGDQTVDEIETAEKNFY